MVNDHDLLELNVLYVDLTHFCEVLLDPTLKSSGLRSALAQEMGILNRDIINIFFVDIPMPKPRGVKLVHAAYDKSDAEHKTSNWTRLQDMLPDPSPDKLHLVVRTKTDSKPKNIKIFNLDTQELQYTDKKSVNFFEDKIGSLLPGLNVQFYRPSHPIYLDDENSVLGTIDESSLKKVPKGEYLDTAYPRGYGPNRLHFVIVDRKPTPKENNIVALPNIARRQRFLNTNPAKRPSSEAVLSNFIETQQEDKSAIMCGRPLDCEERIPPSLLDETLAKFRHDLKTITPSSQDIAAFQDLRKDLSGIFTLESERREKLIDILNVHNIVPEGLYPSKIADYTTDGDLRQIIKGVNFLYYIQEIRNEVGTGGGDPYYEAVRYYFEQIRLILKSGKLTEVQYDRLKFPAILLVHCGAYICVAAAVFTVHPVVEHLACIPLHVHSTNEEELAAGERMIASLRKALVDLQTFYSSINTINKFSPSFEYPFRTFYEIHEGDETLRCHFKYKAMVEDKRVFSGRTEDNQDVIIKFSQRYCEAAHRAAYNMGIAPKLITANLVYGWYMIVMEDVSAFYTPAWDIRASLSPSEKESIQEKTRAAVSRLNDAGFVHGDIRSYNVLLRRDGDGVNSKLSELLIVDWDWAGEEGKVFYPRSLNTELWWPAGVGVGMPIIATHDIEMATRLVM